MVRALRDSFDGSLETFKRELRERDHFDYGRFGDLLNVYAMAAAYSPEPEFPTEVLLPFELGSGRLFPEVWEMWLAHDPVRMAPRYAQALRGLRYVHIDAGRSDEYHLDLGAQAFSDELTKLGVQHSFELFDGRQRRHHPPLRARDSRAAAGPGLSGAGALVGGGGQRATTTAASLSGRGSCRVRRTSTEPARRSRGPRPGRGARPWAWSSSAPRPIAA